MCGKTVVVRIGVALKIDEAVQQRTYCADRREVGRPDALRFMPALNVRRQEIDLMIDCLDAILTKAGIARRVA